MPKLEIEPIRDMATDTLLTPENCVVVLIDYQPEQVATVRSSPIEDVMLNAKAVVKIAHAYNVPIVLTTVAVDMGVNTGTVEELMQEMPGQVEIDRTGVNSWEDEDFRNAIKATGRKKAVKRLSCARFGRKYAVRSRRSICCVKAMKFIRWSMPLAAFPKPRMIPR